MPKIKLVTENNKEQYAKEDAAALAARNAAVQKAAAEISEAGKENIQKARQEDQARRLATAKIHAHLQAKALVPAEEEDGLSAFFKMISEIFMSLFKGIFGDFFGGLSNSSGPGLDLLSKLSPNLGGDLKKAIKQQIMQEPEVQEAVQLMHDGRQALNDMQPLINGVRRAQNAVASAKQTISNATEKTKQFVSDAVSSTKKTLTPLFQGVKQAASNAATSVMQKAKAILRPSKSQSSSEENLDSQANRSVRLEPTKQPKLLKRAEACFQEAASKPAILPLFTRVSHAASNTASRVASKASTTLKQGLSWFNKKPK